MIFISPQKEYPRFYGDVQLDKPGWQLGDVLPEGWIEVSEVTPPSYQADETVVSEFPVETDGQWNQAWSVRKLTVEELAIKNAPKTAKAKLIELGLTEAEIRALVTGLVGA
jgi:hypothetical protein